MGSPKPQLSFIVKLGAPTKISRLRNTLQQQLLCKWMKITMTSITERQRARLYTKKAKIAKRFLYTKHQTLFKKLDNSRYAFYTKIQTLDVTGYSWKFWTYNLYTKSMTLCVTWHFIQKARHFAKSKTICNTFFIYKSHTLDDMGFSWNFRSWHLYKKYHTLSDVTFLYTKTSHFYVTQFFFEFLKFTEGGGHLFL